MTKTIQELQKETNKKLQEVILDGFEDVERFVLKIANKKQAILQEAQVEAKKIQEALQPKKK